MTEKEMIVLQDRLSKRAEEMGADLVGFCGEGSVKTALAPDLSSAVSFAVKLSDAVLATIEDAPSFAYFHHYRTANSLLDSIAFRMSREIEKTGFRALPVAASQSQGKNAPYNGVVAHKTVAVKCGLGYVGKNGLFISPNFGSKIRLATVLTDMPFVCNRPVMQNGCGDCDICRRACPAGAIWGMLPTSDGERNLDPEKCSRYMKEHFQDIGRGSVCGICMKVCPKNKLQ